MELQGDLVLRVSTAQRVLFNPCPVIQGHMSLLHMPLSAIPVCQAGIVCLALCTCVLQVCGLLFCMPLKPLWKDVYEMKAKNRTETENNYQLKMHAIIQQFNKMLCILCMYALPRVCSVTCRLLLPWRNWIWLERLSRGNLRSWPRLLVCLSVQAVWWRPLLLFKKWHSCDWPMSERVLLLTWKHLSTTSLTDWR